MCFKIEKLLEKKLSPGQKEKKVFWTNIILTYGLASIFGICTLVSEKEVSLLIGIKIFSDVIIPATIALITTLICQTKTEKESIALIFIFVIGSAILYTIFICLFQYEEKFGYVIFVSIIQVLITLALLFSARKMSYENFFFDETQQRHDDGNIIGE